MHGDLSIRSVRTGSGATALQVVRYVKKRRVVIRHIGSASTDDELAVLWQKAEMIRGQIVCVAFVKSKLPSLYDVYEIFYGMCMKHILRIN